MSTTPCTGKNQGDVALLDRTASVPPYGVSTASAIDVNAMLRKIRAEFLDMPGLRLTDNQAQRLWALDRFTCAALLATLIEARVLERAPDGRVAARGKTDRRVPMASALEQ